MILASPLSGVRAADSVQNFHPFGIAREAMQAPALPHATRTRRRVLVTIPSCISFCMLLNAVLRATPASRAMLA
jgi:hypothetical protein